MPDFQNPKLLPEYIQNMSGKDKKRINRALLYMIEVEVMKARPNTSFIAGLVENLQPGTLDGHLMDAIAKEYQNATRVNNYNSEKLESIMNELRPMSHSFTNKLAEAMGLVQDLSNAPHFAYQSPLRYPDNGQRVEHEPGSYGSERRYYGGLQDGEFLGSFEAVIDSMAENALGQQPGMSKALANLQAEYVAAMGYTSNAIKSPKIGFDDLFESDINNRLHEFAARIKGAAEALSQFGLKASSAFAAGRHTENTASESLNPYYWEENYGPFAAIAEKLFSGEAMSDKDLYFYLQNRHTKYADAIGEAMLEFGKDKHGPENSTN